MCTKYAKFLDWWQHKEISIVKCTLLGSLILQKICMTACFHIVIHVCYDSICCFLHLYCIIYWTIIVKNFSKAFYTFLYKNFVPFIGNTFVRLPLISIDSWTLSGFICKTVLSVPRSEVKRVLAAFYKRSFYRTTGNSYVVCLGIKSAVKFLREDEKRRDVPASVVDSAAISFIIAAHASLSCGISTPEVTALMLYQMLSCSLDVTDHFFSHVSQEEIRWTVELKRTSVELAFKNRIVQTQAQSHHNYRDSGTICTDVGVCFMNPGRFVANYYVTQPKVCIYQQFSLPCWIFRRIKAKYLSFWLVVIIS